MSSPIRLPVEIPFRGLAKVNFTWAFAGLSWRESYSAFLNPATNAIDYVAFFDVIKYVLPQICFYHKNQGRLPEK